MDEWHETETVPDLVVNLPGTFDTLIDGAAQGVIDIGLGTVWNNWNDTRAGAVQEVNRRIGRIESLTEFHQ